MGISIRIKEERTRLGMTQQEFADAAGVTSRSQTNYETADRTPNADYLATLAGMGADVLYILTGQRTPVAGAVPISAGDRVLLDNFHAAPEQVQAGIKTALGAFADAPRQVGKRKKAA